MTISSTTSLQNYASSSTAAQATLVDASMTTSVVTGSTAAPGIVLVVTINTAVTTTATMTPLALLVAAMQTLLTTSTTLGSSMTVVALMSTHISIGTSVPLFTQGGVTHVVNWDTKACSTYEGYPFNSFAQIGGVYYGAQPSGLCSLNGPDDAGTAIPASVGFGKQRMKSETFKRLVAAYAGASSTGQLYMKVIYNDTKGQHEYVYKARRNSDDYLRMQRFDVGRGIKAHYFTFELYNSDGCDFDLKTVEFVSADMNRRM